jgi:plastocyanin
MRRLAPAAALVLALALGSGNPAGAHPGHGADAVAIDGDALRYAPPTVTVGVGDTVVWFWGGVTRNHSVTADPGQAESFDSDPGGPPDGETHPAGSGFSHVFTQQGRFTYYCQNHATMRGLVEVVAVPDPAPGPPRLSDLRVAPRGERIRVGFFLSERADLVARIAERRDGAWRAVETFQRQAYAGQNRLKLPAASLDPGRYRLTLTAYDDADERAEARARFSVREPER